MRALLAVVLGALPLLLVLSFRAGARWGKRRREVSGWRRRALDELLQEVFRAKDEAWRWERRARRLNWRPKPGDGVRGTRRRGR